MKKLLILFLLISNVRLFGHDTAAYNLAKQCLIKDELLKGLDICNDILSKDDRYVDAYVLRGGFHLDLKSPLDALSDFNTAISIDSNNHDAYIGRSLYYQQYDFLEESMADLIKAESINDTGITLFYYRSFLYNKMHLYQQNIRQLSKGLKHHPENITFLQSRSYAYVRNKQYDSAMLDAQHILKLDSTDVTAMTNIGFCYIKLKQYDKAYRIYRKMNITTEHHPYLMSNYGYSLYKTGKTIEGIQFIYESLKVMPENSYAHRYLAEISIQEKDMEQACYHIKKSIDLGYTKAYDNDMEDLQKKYCQ